MSSKEELLEFKTLNPKDPLAIMINIYIKSRVPQSLYLAPMIAERLHVSVDDLLVKELNIKLIYL